MQLERIKPIPVRQDNNSSVSPSPSSKKSGRGIFRRKGNKKNVLLVPIGILMILVGLFLLLYQSLQTGGFPYSYNLIQSGKPEAFSQFKDITFHGRKDPFIKRYDIIISSDKKPAGTLYAVTDKDRPPVIIEYSTESSLPLIMMPVSHEAYVNLYRKITENTDQDSLFISWWDNSLRINLLTGREVLVDEFIGEPLFIPEEWNTYRDDILNHERRFWDAGTTGGNSSTTIRPEQKKRFRALVNAFLSNEEDGYKRLKELSGGKRTYIVVDQRDVLKLAGTAGGGFQAGFNDFYHSGDLHSVIKKVKKWLKDNGLKDYMVEEIDENRVRVYYLMRPGDNEKLLARLLPFTSSNPFQLKNFKIRYQASTIWVYELI